MSPTRAHAAALQLTLTRKTGRQVALNWVMCKGAIPIPGARSEKQALDNAGAMGWRMSDEEVRLGGRQSRLVCC
eukprot:1356522-Rhodomonas_salina.1